MRELLQQLQPLPGESLSAQPKCRHLLGVRSRVPALLQGLWQHTRTELAPGAGLLIWQQLVRLLQQAEQQLTSLPQRQRHLHAQQLLPLGCIWPAVALLDLQQMQRLYLLAEQVSGCPLLMWQLPDGSSLLWPLLGQQRARMLCLTG